MPGGQMHLGGGKTTRAEGRRCLGVHVEVCPGYPHPASLCPRSPGPCTHTNPNKPELALGAKCVCAHWS